MQLLDTPQLDIFIQSTLQDIAKNLEIDTFCVRHPDYQPFELPIEITDRFQQVPKALSLKYTILHLRSFLYGIYYNGSMRSALAIQAETSPLALQQNLENNTMLGVDLAFFDRLHQSNQGTGYFDPGWTILRQETDGALAVQRGGLTVHIDPDRHLAPGASTNLGEQIAIRMPKNLVQNGFYMAVSNAGIDRHSPFDSASTLVRLYFNYTPEGAIALMSQLTEQLSAILFTFKTLYNPSEYSRYDAGVLYVDRQDYSRVREVLQPIYASTQAFFKPEVPLFTKLLAPGLGLAEEPNQKFAAQESFGMNRCQIVAQGLMAAQQAGDESAVARLEAIAQQFNLLEIDSDRPYLNANSEDIYQPLSI